MPILHFPAIRLEGANDAGANGLFAMHNTTPLTTNVRHHQHYHFAFLGWGLRSVLNSDLDDGLSRNIEASFQMRPQYGGEAP